MRTARFTKRLRFAPVLGTVALVSVLYFGRDTPPEVAEPPEPEMEVAVRPQSSNESVPRILWDLGPERVDPERYQAHRLPGRTEDDEFPLLLRIPKNVRVPNNAEFSFDGQSFRIVDVVPVAPTKICIDDLGRRSACGARARIQSRNAVAGRVLKCRVLDQSGTSTVIDCKFGTSTLSQVLTESSADALRQDAAQSTVRTSN